MCWTIKDSNSKGTRWSSLSGQAEMMRASNPMDAMAFTESGLREGSYTWWCHRRSKAGIYSSYVIYMDKVRWMRVSLVL
jgi:hypothetical protein